MIFVSRSRIVSITFDYLKIVASIPTAHPVCIGKSGWSSLSRIICCVLTLGRVFRDKGFWHLLELEGSLVTIRQILERCQHSMMILFVNVIFIVCDGKI